VQKGLSIREVCPYPGRPFPFKTLEERNAARQVVNCKDG